MLSDLLLKVKNRKQLVLLVPILGGVLLGGLIVVKPLLARIAALDAEKSSLSKKETLWRHVLEQEKKLSGYRQRLSSNLDKAKFIEELNTLAGQSGLTVLSMVPEEKKITAVYLEEIDVRIDTEGSYHQLGEFVSRVENLQQFTKIVMVDVLHAGPNTDAAYKLPVGVVPRARPSSNKISRISMVVGVFYPAKDVF